MPDESVISLKKIASIPLKKEVVAKETVVFQPRFFWTEKIIMKDARRIPVQNQFPVTVLAVANNCWGVVMFKSYMGIVKTFCSSKNR